MPDRLDEIRATITSTPPGWRAEMPADDLRLLVAEIDRLRGLLAEHGIEVPS